MKKPDVPRTPHGGGSSVPHDDLGYFESAGGEPASTLPPKGTFVGKPSPYDDRILQLDLEAIDEAYRKQVELLFSVWMKDDKGQPQRATQGIQQARRAYLLSREALEKRARELQER